ncbi:cupin domain-containing protein [Alteripontixanthobacter maritimus]|nr:hypothetical protein [Alteripontixanthobacter maritimus]
MERRSILKAVLATALLPATIACADNTAPDYRYRLTVEVDTPDGLRTGSSVIEVRQKLVRSGANPSSVIVSRRAYGEAVTVDLPNGGTLFALLSSEDQIDWAASVMQQAAPKVSGEIHQETFDNMLLIDGEVKLPRYWSINDFDLKLSGYPFLVTFTDPNDPSSVQIVDPDNLDEKFGHRVNLQRITVQITDDPVTNSISKKLRWLYKPFDRQLTKDDFPSGLPVGDLDGMFLKE